MIKKNKMTNYICLLLTSNGCGHCSAFRGDGLINNGKAYMKPEYMKTLFTQVAKGSNFHLLNIHYENMSGKANFISDISKFTYTKRGILQQRYFRYENYTRLRSIVASKNNKELSVKNVLDNDKKVNWKDFIKNKIPEQIENYTYYYPCFMIIKTSDWNKALKDRNYPMPALTNAGITIEEDGVMKLDRNPATFSKRNVDVKTLIRQVTNGETKIEAAVEKKAVVEKKAKSVVNSNFVIKSYDD